MARPDVLDLTVAEQPWRRVPMEGANTGIDVVPLASHPYDFVILARFPAGFSRPVRGGYHAAETFLVLDGVLELNGRTFRRGDLTHVPAEAVRHGMAAVDGCTALAWFSGPATFLTPYELGEADRSISTVRIEADAPHGVVLTTPEADWSIGEAGSERVSLDLTRWGSAASEMPVAAALLRHRH